MIVAPVIRDRLAHGGVYAVVLAGGAGTRFWPASRAALPKQLLPLGGGAPLLAETIARVLPLVGGMERVLVAGGRATQAATRALLTDLPPHNLLVEPAPRNTAPCIAWAAQRVFAQDPEGVCVVLPSDQHVRDGDGFRACLAHAVEAARAGRIVTIGLRPTRPETGFGYIELADGDGPVRAVARFVEKPDAARAEAYVAGGRHLWNAGIFVFRAADMLAQVRAHLPAIAAAVTQPEAEIDEWFPRLPSISVDYGVMEKLGPGEVAVVPGDFGWSDVGSWQAAWELADKDELGNTRGEGLLYVDAQGNHVARSGRGEKLVALLGVSGLAVIETDDALLVLPRERAQDVRLVIEALKKDRPDLL